MCRLIETIRLLDGRVENSEYHQQRIDRSFAEFFKNSLPINLNNSLTDWELPSTGLHKIKLVYDHEVRSIEVTPYEQKKIQKLKIVHADYISYSFKFEDRAEIEKFYAQRGQCDDIIIVKNNFITDASFANLVFKKGSQWVTPKTYLLNGTLRQSLLDKKIIIEDNITINDLVRYQKVKLINALLQFASPEIDVSQVVL